MIEFVGTVILEKLKMKNILFYSVMDTKMNVMHCLLNLNSFTSFESLNTEQKFHFIMSYNEGDVEILKHQFNSLEWGSHKMT